MTFLMFLLLSIWTVGYGHLKIGKYILGPSIILERYLWYNASNETNRDVAYRMYIAGGPSYLRSIEH